MVQKKSIRHEVSNAQITVHWVGSPPSQRVMCEPQTSSSDAGITEMEEKVVLHSYFLYIEFFQPPVTMAGYNDRLQRPVTMAGYNGQLQSGYNQHALPYINHVLEETVL